MTAWKASPEVVIPLHCFTYGSGTGNGESDGRGLLAGVGNGDTKGVPPGAAIVPRPPYPLITSGR